MSPENKHEVKRKHRSTGFWVFVLIAGLVGAVLVGGAFVSTQASGFFGHSGHERRGHFTRDPEMARQHAEFAASWVLGRIDMPPTTRRSKYRRSSATVSRTLSRSHNGVGRITRPGELSSPNPPSDRVALEQLRTEGIELADTASTRLVEALADAAEVLTPEQRAELMEMADRFHER